MRSYDLAPLLAASTASGLGFRQGRVLSFNSSTGSNTIDVQGTALVDVPMLNSGEAVSLKAGHIVGLLTFGSSWWILGRIVLPNNSQFASSSVAFGTAAGALYETTFPNVSTSICPSPMAVPSWANQALVLSTVFATGDNTGNTALDNLQIAAGINGQYGQIAMTLIPPDKQASISATYAAVVNNPGGSINCDVQVKTGYETWGNGWNRCAVNAIGLFHAV